MKPCHSQTIFVSILEYIYIVARENAQDNYRNIIHYVCAKHFKTNKQFLYGNVDALNLLKKIVKDMKCCLSTL